MPETEWQAEFCGCIFRFNEHGDIVYLSLCNSCQSELEAEDFRTVEEIVEPLPPGLEKGDKI